MTKWQWLLLQLTRKLWVRAAAFGVVAMATALVAVVADRFWPGSAPFEISASAVERVLDILASSMLAVTTFSLSVMVAAYAAATSNVTPRATKLLMQDVTTQNVLAAFIGSFLFSLIGIVALSTKAYGETGRAVLFVVTLGVIALIVTTLMRWIDHLSRLGRVGETTGRVEQATAKALLDRIAHPYLGGRHLEDPAHDIPAAAAAVYATVTGYVQHIDVAALSACVDEDGQIFIGAVPGAFVHRGRPLAWTLGVDASEGHEAVARAFTVATERSFDQDPRFGFSVLSEIASRALSPAVNDPGTAIDVIGRGVRILENWELRPDAAHEIEHPRVWVPRLSPGDIFDDFFSPIARDGAAVVEVQIRLQKALGALAGVSGEFRQHAARHSRLCVRRATQALTLEEEKNLVLALANEIG